MTAMLPQHDADPDDENLFGPVAQLATLATELSRVPLGPSATFRTELRHRLLAEAKGVGGAGVPGARRPARPMPRRNRARRTGRRVAAAGLALALTGGGVAAAAGSALPGQPLYPVKRFGQSLRLALAPGSDVAASLRLVSARVSEVERTVAADPSGADASRWRAMDSALADADSRLVRLSASAPAQELGSALAPDRVRLDTLLPAVPEGHRSAVRQLRDTMDGLAAVLPTTGAGGLPVDLLPAGRLAPANALAAGWPLDPAMLQPPAAPGLPTPQAGGPGQLTPSQSGSGGTGSTAGAASSDGSTTTLQSTQGNLPAAAPRASTSSGTVLPRTTAGIRTTINGVTGTLGATGSKGTSTSGGSTATGGRAASQPIDGAVGTTVGAVLGDATDTVRRLPLTNGLLGPSTP